jgi:hypothetical protein
MRARSSLAKGPYNLLLKWFEQVVERAALVDLDEDLGRHAGNEANILQMSKLRCRQNDANRVIRLLPADWNFAARV